MSPRGQYNRFRKCKQHVSVENPHIQSPAALVLLTCKLHLQDKSRFTSGRMMSARRKWMKAQVRLSKGLLTCAICGKSGLNPFTDDKNKLATLDHIVELRNGGSWWNPLNFQVACYSCNNNRSNPH